MQLKDKWASIETRLQSELEKTLDLKKMQVMQETYVASGTSHPSLVEG